MKKSILFMALCLTVQSVDAQRRYTVEECIDSALVYNRTLQNAALEIEAAGQQKREAFTKYFPEIKANVTAFRAFDELVKSDALGLAELNSGYGATVSVMQPLFAGGQIVTANRLTEVQQEVCRLQLQLKEREVREKITENFWQICILRYNLRTIEAAERQMAAVSEQVQHLVDAGVTTRNALLQVRLRENELKANRLKLENADRTLVMLLAQQVGCAASTGEGAEGFDIVVPDPKELPSLPLEEAGWGAWDEAALRRPELALATQAAQAQRLQVRMERGKLLPTVAVGVMGVHLGMGGLSDQVKAMTDTHLTNGVALGTVSVPISDWWGGSHAIRRQKIRLREAENDLLDARENLRIDISAAYNNLTEAYQQVAIAQSSVEEAEENLRMHTEQYRSGTVTLTDLLDAETLNRKSHDQLSSAIASYHVALVRYRLKAE